jgi:hypothetical protein
MPPLEWVTVNLPWCAYRDDYGDGIERQIGFMGHAACVPGVLIEIQRRGARLDAVNVDGTPLVDTYLIGDMNAHGGCCDCCPGPGDDDIVLRYVRLVVLPLEEG